MFVGLPGEPREKGFTLLEMAICVVVILILVVLGVACARKIQSKAEMVQCSANLKSLYIATTGYMTDHKQWPQIIVDPKIMQFTKEWIAALRPYKIDERSWVCPTIQRKLKKPDLTIPKNQRLDYIPTPFGPHSNKPFQWSTQPWFLEVGNSHGNGNLLIFMDGSIRPFGDMARLPKTGN